jgi:micrococcal nuclease
VIDGDTVIVEFAGGAKEIVRLLGVDTPETVDPNRPVQCFGAEASTYVATLIPPGTEVRLERDVEARDHFGRLLAYIYRRSDGLFINRDLLRLGFADLSIYPPNDTYATDLQTVTTSARTQALGLWGACGGPDVPLDPPMR